jgi:hypothetical protein
MLCQEYMEVLKRNASPREDLKEHFPPAPSIFASNCDWRLLWSPVLGKRSFFSAVEYEMFKKTGTCMPKGFAASGWVPPEHRVHRCVEEQRGETRLVSQRLRWAKSGVKSKTTMRLSVCKLVPRATRLHDDSRVLKSLRKRLC